MAQGTGRREFLQSAGLTAAAGLIATPNPLEAVASAPAADPVAPKTMGARFRELLQKRAPFENVAAYDSFTARMVELIGFPSIYLGGSLAAEHHTQPAWLVSVGERLEYFRKISENVDIPTLVDVEGGGDPATLYRTTKQFEAARAGGIHFVDNIVGSLGVVTGVLPVDKMVDKIHAAVDARSDMVVTVRCTAAMQEGKDKAIERGVAYAKAGAETIWFTGLMFEDYPKVVDAIGIPLTAQVVMDTQKTAITTARITMAVYASLLQNIAQSAVYDALNELKTTGMMVKSAGGVRLGNRIPAEFRARIMRADDIAARGKKYNVG
jgi:methylisocitrate lyase